MRTFLITAVDSINVFTLSTFLPSDNHNRQLEVLKILALQWPLHCFQISPFYFILNIKQLFLLCPLHNCHRHLEPYVPVWCTPWTSAECQKYGLQKILHDVSLCPRQQWDGNLPRKLGKELTVAFSLLESPWWCSYHVCSRLLNQGSISSEPDIHTSVVKTIWLICDVEPDTYGLPLCPALHKWYKMSAVPTQPSAISKTNFQRDYVLASWFQRKPNH